MKINKVFAIIQLSLMYISLVLLYVGFLTPNSEEDLTTALVISGFVMALLAGAFATAICVISFVSIFKRGVKDYTKFVMIYKIIAIPWFIANFVLCVLLIGGMLNPFLLIAIPLVVTILVSSTYINMVSSSMIDFGYVLSSMRRKVIRLSPLLIIGLIFGFNFCLDVVGAILIFVGNKKQLRVIS